VQDIRIRNPVENRRFNTCLSTLPYVQLESATILA